MTKHPIEQEKAEDKPKNSHWITGNVEPQEQKGDTVVQDQACK